MTQEPAREIAGNKREDAVFRLLDDELGESVEGQRVRVALVDHGRDASADADEVGVEPEIARNVLINMRMGIDETRCDDETPGHITLALPGSPSWCCTGGDAIQHDVAYAVDMVLFTMTRPPLTTTSKPGFSFAIVFAMTLPPDIVPSAPTIMLAHMARRA